ncbi:MAG: hypothetical protein ACO4AI_09960 [Prochlorothrix sp.]
MVDSVVAQFQEASSRKPVPGGQFRAASSLGCAGHRRNSSPQLEGDGDGLNLMTGISMAYGSHPAIYPFKT